jgi:hypothetical protein
MGRPGCKVQASGSNANRPAIVIQQLVNRLNSIYHTGKLLLPGGKRCIREIFIKYIFLKNIL